MSDAPRGDAGPAAGETWWGDQPDPATPPAKPRNRNRMLAIGVFAVMLVIGAVVGGVLASSSKSSNNNVTAGGATNGSGNGSGNGAGGRRRPGTRGTIAAISGSTISLTTTNGTVDVAVASTTTITDTTKGTLADVKPGDHVRVIGALSGSTVPDAQSVVDTGTLANVGGFGGGGGRPGGTGVPPTGQGTRRAGGLTNGTVTSVEGATIVVKTTAGATVRVTTTSATVVQLTKKISLTDLAKGDAITVTGTPNGSSMTATSIRRGAGAFGAGGPGGGGFGGGGPGGGGPGGGFDGGSTTLPGA